MWSYVVRRLIFGAILVFAATIVSFTILRMSPGEPGQAEIDPRMSQDYIDQQKKLFGEDQPPVRQYLRWLGVLKLVGADTTSGILQGSMGRSRMYDQPVAGLVKSRIGATIMLNMITLLFTWLVAIPLGTWAAVKQYKWPDKFLAALSFCGMSAPGFFLALLLLWIFCSHLNLLPPGGLRAPNHDMLNPVAQVLDYLKHMIVPVLVLTFGALAGLQRIMRGKMLETLRENYIVTARAKGLSTSKVLYKHAMRNAINPLVTLLGFQFAGLFSGSALLENVINYPGMGQLMLSAARAKDQAVVMSVFLIGALMLVVGNLLAELLLGVIDPRVTYA